MDDDTTNIPSNYSSQQSLSPNFIFNHVPSLQQHKLPSEQPLIPELSNISHSIPHPCYVDVAPTENPSSISVIPSYSAWFSFDQVHDIEKRAFPEYFSSLATRPSQDEYIQIRNFIVKAYQKDPVQYITVTACRRHLSADVPIIMKIHAFLEHWGLIHYNSHPTLLESTNDSIILQGPQSSRIVKPSEFQSTNLFLYQQTSPSTHISTITCHSCGLLCEEEFYHCLKIPSINICKPCFYDGRFPSTMFSGDFIRLPVVDSLSDQSHSLDPWSDQETLYLLEGIEMYGDQDWEQISRHVGTRTKEECIRHFIQMPIQDPYLNVSSSIRLIPNEKILPFCSSSNPTMSLIHFLATMIHPSVASATAQSAIKEYEKLHNTIDQDNENIQSKQNDQELMKILLESAGERASQVLEQEDDKVERYIAVLIEAYLKKLDIKLKHFEQMEQLVQTERAELEKQKMVLYEERMRLLEGEKVSQIPSDGEDIIQSSMIVDDTKEIDKYITEL